MPIRCDSAAAMPLNLRSFCVFSRRLRFYRPRRFNHCNVSTRDAPFRTDLRSSRTFGRASVVLCNVGVVEPDPRSSRQNFAAVRDFTSAQFAVLGCCADIKLCVFSVFCFVVCNSAAATRKKNGKFFLGVKPPPGIRGDSDKVVRLAKLAASV